MHFNTNLIFYLEKTYNASMWYVQVIVADATYHKNEALTYSSDKHVVVGQIVELTLQRKRALGIVIAVLRSYK